MMRAFALAATAGLVAFATAPAIALPKIESSTRANGVVAFQDEADPKQFHIYPERIPLVLGLTLSDPSVKYWGIGAPFRQKDPEYGLYVPIVGATISGLATVTITPDQETAIRAAIKRDFEVTRRSSPISMARPRASSRFTPPPRSASKVTVIQSFRPRFASVRPSISSWVRPTATLSRPMWRNAFATSPTSRRIRASV